MFRVDIKSIFTSFHKYTSECAFEDNLPIICEYYSMHTYNEDKDSEEILRIYEEAAEEITKIVNDK